MFQVFGIPGSESALGFSYFPPTPLLRIPHPLYSPLLKDGTTSTPTTTTYHPSKATVKGGRRLAVRGPQPSALYLYVHDRGVGPGGARSGGGLRAEFGLSSRLAFA